MKKNLNKKGFTIVELVIVIAVIAILAAVLIPTFSNVITSANKSANLSEAQSTLKSYTAFMSSNGQELSDGPVFQVVDGEDVKATYVYYKGQLHEFSLTSTLAEGQATAVAPGPGPLVSIGTTSYACNKSFQLNDDNGSVYEIGEEAVTFYYSDQEPVKFDDGSLKCKIYPGCIKTGTNTLYVMVTTNMAGATLETAYVASGEVTTGYERTITVNFATAVSDTFSVDISVGGDKVKDADKTKISGVFDAEREILTITLEEGFDVNGVITITTGSASSPTLELNKVTPEPAPEPEPEPGA